MKKITFFAAIAMIAFTSNAVAQETASSTSKSTTQIIAPISISNSTLLQFGNVISTALGYEVQVTSANTRVGAIETTTNSDGGYAAGVFDVTGESGFTYAVTLPADDVVTLVEVDGEGIAVTTGGGIAMAVKTFENNSTGLIASGVDQFSVGAILVVGDAQAAGSYSGDYTVTVEYD